MCIVTHLEDYTVIFLNSFSIYSVFFWGHVLGLMFPENDLSKLILTFLFFFFSKAQYLPEFLHSSVNFKIFANIFKSTQFFDFDECEKKNTVCRTALTGFA